MSEVSLTFLAWLPVVARCPNVEADNAGSDRGSCSKKLLIAHHQMVRDSTEGRVRGLRGFIFIYYYYYYFKKK